MNLVTMNLVTMNLVTMNLVTMNLVTPIQQPRTMLELVELRMYVQSIGGRHEMPRREGLAEK